MGTTKIAPATGWIQDRTTLLYHYYQEQPGQVAHPPLCQGPVLLTPALRRQVAALPEGLKPRYRATNQSALCLRDGLCKACSNRYANLKK